MRFSRRFVDLLKPKNTLFVFAYQTFEGCESSALFAMAPRPIRCAPEIHSRAARYSTIRHRMKDHYEMTIACDSTLTPDAAA